MEISTELYVRLSALMFMEFAVWGAWMPVLATRLLGPLKMSGKQTGWIYATLPLASMISPLVGGQLADKYVDAGWLLAVAHLAGAILMFLAINQKTFGRLFTVMLLYSLCYAATVPLVTTLMFRHLKAPAEEAPLVFIWAPVAWALVGYLLTGWRQWRGGAGDGSDCLVFAAVLSVIMAAVCLVQPATPPLPQTDLAASSPMVAALGMLRDMDYGVFIAVSMLVAGMMQFYFLGTGQFLQDNGISGKYVPGSMAIAQAVQAAATFFLLGRLYNPATGIGPHWTLTVGVASWAVLYLIYILVPARAVLVVAQAFHGLAYVLFIIAGQTYVNDVAPAAISGSAQSILTVVTNGIGLFFSTQLAGVVMDQFRADGKFQWSKIWMVPLGVVLAGTLILATVFQGKLPEKKTDAKAPAKTEAQAGAAELATAGQLPS